jgi:hypothetical protein
LQAHCQSHTNQHCNQALSKSLQSQPKRKRNFKKCPTARQKTMKNETTKGLTNHDRQGSTGGNIMYKNMRLLAWLVI